METLKTARRAVRTKLRVATVVSFLPNPYEHFLFRELAGLAARGVDLAIYAVRGGMEGPSSPDLDLLVPRTRYLAASAHRLVAAHVWALATRPRLWIGALLRILSVRFRRPRDLAVALHSFAVGTGMARDVAEERRDVVFAGWANHPATVAWVAAQLSGARFMFAAHAGDVFLYPDALLPRKARAAEAIVACTAECARSLQTVAPSTPVFVVHHGLGEDWFMPRRRALREDPRLLFVGRLEGSKGEDTALRAVAELRDRRSHVRLTVVGAGPGLNATTRLARELRVSDHVEFRGALSPDHVRALYDDHDVLLLPARQETHFGIPNVLVEAMARGLVPIVSPLASVTSLVEDGRQGFLVPQDDPQAVAVAIERYRADPSAARAMGVAARERVRKRFVLDRSLDALEAILCDPSAVLRPYCLDSSGPADPRSSR